MFLTDLSLTAHRPNEWVLNNPLIWFDRINGRIKVPPGFITDLASIPRALRGVLNVNGRSRKAAVVHDWLYCSRKLTRKQADDLFYRALRAEGVSTVLARVYWSGVRAGGWVYYNKRADGLNHKEDFMGDR